MASNQTLAPLAFKVRRCEPELVSPAEPTPREFKPLSDVDDQLGLRFHVPAIQIYRSSPSMKDIDPVRVIRESLAKALVFYYPLAGRLRNLEPSGKLAVDCTGEGVLFIEADADISLDEFGDFQPPFPCLDQLFYNVPGSGEITDSPLWVVQVTRFGCGGFILAISLNHTMTDALGTIQFMNAIAEIARGATSPSMSPVWKRELLNARNPPLITCSHPEFDQFEDGPELTLDQAGEISLSHRSFFFGKSEISKIRNSLPSPQRDYSTFNVVAAFLWRCRIISLNLNSDDVVHGVVNVNIRSKFEPSLPKGYYGNAFAFSVARATAGELVKNPLEHTVELVRKAKEKVTEEFMHSMVDLVVSKGRSRFPASRPYIMSDIRNIGFGDLDFGWGKPIYGGVAGAFPGDASFLVRFKNSFGEEGISVAVCLPSEAMQIFVQQFNILSSN